MARPIPRPDPVTNADLPFNVKDMVLPPHGSCPKSLLHCSDFIAALH
jgi:hypothetical protein